MYNMKSLLNSPITKCSWEDCMTDTTKKSIKKFIYIITIIIMIISFSVFFFSCFLENTNQDDLFMDNFLLVIDVLICFFLLFCEFEIGNCLTYFLAPEKSRVYMLFKVLTFSFSLAWLLMLFITYNSTNVFLSELLILIFTVMLLFSKLMCIFTKNK